MSTAHDAHAAAAHAPHDDHHFDGEPVTELSADEPRTPGWVPLLGAALFAVGAVYMLVRSDDEPAPEPAPVAIKAAAPEAAPRPAAAPPVQHVAAPPAAPAASGSAASALQKLSPDQINKLKARMDRSRKKGAATTGGH